ncbi:hypothetical protein EYC95_22690 [Pseudomonas sp. BGI-2]|nr:hypothetical protein EYC95_22690 [Pseudomonas sp. BGI-2]
MRGFSETSHRPVGSRSGPQRPFRHTELSGFTTASQPNGDKSPRHRVLARLRLSRLLRQSGRFHVSQTVVAHLPARTIVA